jgi:DNA uptake protein ComE-like DNA-binding protein
MKNRFSCTLAIAPLFAIALSNVAFPQTRSQTKDGAGQNSGTTTSTAPKPAPAKPSTAAAAIDLNAATREQLMTLPDVNATLVQKIIDGRPYKGVYELTEKKILSEAAYLKIKDKVIAKQTIVTAKPPDFTRNTKPSAPPAIKEK